MDKSLVIEGHELDTLKVYVKAADDALTAWCKAGAAWEQENTVANALALDKAVRVFNDATSHLHSFIAALVKHGEQPPDVG